MRLIAFLTRVVHMIVVDDKKPIDDVRIGNPEVNEPASDEFGVMMGDVRLRVPEDFARNLVAHEPRVLDDVLNGQL